MDQVEVRNLIGNEVVDHGADYDDYIWDNYITYENSFNEKHNLTVLLGASFSHEEGDILWYQGTTTIATNNPDQTIWDMEIINPRFIPSEIAIGNNVFEKRLSSIFTRVQYNYKGKYLLSAVMRRDGSSAFGPNNKYGYFPSGSVGWNVSEENFLKDSSWINNLKAKSKLRGYW